MPGEKVGKADKVVCNYGSKDLTYQRNTGGGSIHTIFTERARKKSRMLSKVQAERGMNGGSILERETRRLKGEGGNVDQKATRKKRKTSRKGSSTTIQSRGEMEAREQTKSLYNRESDTGT